MREGGEEEARMKPEGCGEGFQRLAYAFVRRLLLSEALLNRLHMRCVLRIVVSACVWEMGQ